jgi:3'-5' exoribonuclease
MTIKELTTLTNPVPADVRAQITGLLAKETKDQKPYWDLSLGDGTAEITIKVWSDAPAARMMPDLSKGTFVECSATWSRNSFGVDAKNLEVSFICEEAIEQLLSGTPERQAFITNRMQRIRELISSMASVPLRLLCEKTLERYEAAIQRAAAARTNHHARRGGLVEHVCEMMETGDAIASVYDGRNGASHSGMVLNRSLVLAGIFFHDIGKLWENQYEPRGFAMPHTRRAELFGHIYMGAELARSIWRTEDIPLLCTNRGEACDDHELDCLVHCILSHHGELAYGSPVVPKFPEAMVIHYIDQISAKLEMFKELYLLPEIGPGVHDRAKPMWISAVEPVRESTKFQTPSSK